MTHGTPAKRLRFALLLRLLHREYALGVKASLAEAGFGDIRSGDAKVFPFVPAEGIQVRDLAALRLPKIPSMLVKQHVSIRGGRRRAGLVGVCSGC